MSAGWCGVAASGEFQMDEHKRSAAEELDYQLATRYFASAFEHFDRLPADDQQSLLQEISNQISKRLAAAALRGE
jgi:hypothetical protein